MSRVDEIEARLRLRTCDRNCMEHSDAECPGAIGVCQLDKDAVLLNDIAFLISEVRRLKSERDEARALAVELADYIDRIEGAEDQIGADGALYSAWEFVSNDPRLAKIRGKE